MPSTRACEKLEEGDIGATADLKTRSPQSPAWPLVSVGPSPLDLPLKGPALLQRTSTSVQPEKTAARIQADGGRAIAVKVDVSCKSQVDRMGDMTLTAFGSITTLVSCADISTFGHFLDLPEGEWDHVLAVNLKGLFLCGQAVARHMAQHGGGVIVNVTSQTSEVAQEGGAHYIASKGGGKMLTKPWPWNWWSTASA